MKKFTFLVFSFCLASHVYSQEIESYDSTGIPYQQQITHIFEHVNLKAVPNGILYEHGFPLQSFETYPGTLSDSNKTDFTAFGMLYASIYSMAIDNEDRLSNPSGYMTAFDQWDERSAVMVFGLHQEYYGINPQALELNLLQSINNQLYDVEGRTESPYQKKEVFLLAPNVSSYQGISLPIRFHSSLFFNNTGKNIQRIEADFGDGLGYREVGADQQYKAEYAASGIKTIVYRVTYTDQTSYLSHFEITFEKEDQFKSTTGLIPYDLADKVVHITASEPYQGQAGGATVYISYACGHNSLQKPFIWCEGYNPQVGSIDNRLHYIDAVKRINFKDAVLGDKSLSQYLVDEGYDLVVVDYDDGGDYLQRNAFVIEEVIRWVNEEKHRFGSEEKNVIIGQSMGGMMARYALRKMENAGEDHEVGTYISFDSGHLGTNIPLGVQYALRHISGTFVWDEPVVNFVPIIRDAEDLLNLPSSRQMLIYHADMDYYLNTWFPDIVNQTLHDQYYNEQNNFLGMPENCEILAIANGNGSGNGGQVFGEHQLVVHADANRFIIFKNMSDDPFEAAGNMIVTFALGTGVSIDEKIWSVPHQPLNPEFIYKGKITATVLFIPVVFTNTSIKASNTVGLDSSPGGFVGSKVEDENEDQYATPLNVATSWYLPVFKLNAWSFTPTVSTLNFYGSNSNHTEINNPGFSFSSMQMLLQNNTVRDVDNFSVRSGNTYYSQIGGTSPNTPHTWFNDDSAPFMLYHLIGYDGLSGVSSLGSGQVYNFGTKRLHYTTNSQFSPARRTSSVLDHSIDVNNDAVLAVNHYNGIGFDALTTNGPFTDQTGRFMVEVKNRCDFLPILVQVKSGGKLVLGNNSGREGEIHFYDQTILYVENNGIIEVNENSTLVLKSGSRLILDPGSKLIVRNGARFIVEQGARLIYKQNASIITYGGENEIELGGFLVVEHDATFEIDHSLSPESGIVHFTQGIVVQAFPNSRISLIGKSITDPFIVLSQNTEVNFFDNDLLSVRFSQGMVTMEENSRISSSRPFFTSLCNYESNFSNQGLNIYGANSILSSRFTDVQISAYLDLIGSPQLLVGSCKFYDRKDINDGFDKHCIYISGKNFYIANSDFYGNNISIVKSENMTQPSTLLSSNFSRHSSVPLNTPVTGLDDISNSEIYVSSSSFENLYVGIAKFSGKLSLKCSKIQNSTVVANIATGNGCLLNMSTDDAAGYNELTAGNTPNIYILGGLINMKNGYNKLIVPANATSITGTINLSCQNQSSCKLKFPKNQWNNTNTMPPSGMFSLSSWNNYSMTVLVSPVVAKPTCGYYDGPILPDPGNPNMYVLLPTVIQNGVPQSVLLETAVQLGVKKMELFYEEGNDLEAIEIFNAIFQSNLPKNNPNVGPLLDQSLKAMKTAVENAVAEGDILIEANKVSFESPVQKYVNALNFMSDPGVQNQNYKEQFYLEIDKSHLFRLLSKTEKSLEILINLEACGLADEEQNQVNYWKKQYLMDQQKSLLGLAILDTIIIIDTTSFVNKGAKNNNYYFGSQILGANELTYVNCNAPNKSVLTDNPVVNSFNHTIYPVPATESIVISWDSDEVLRLEVLDLSGKKVLDKEINSDENTNISKLNPGIYLYKLYLDGALKFSGKLVKE